MHITTYKNQSHSILQHQVHFTRERDREEVWTHLLCIPIHSTINFFGGGWISCFHCARCATWERWLQILSFGFTQQCTSASKRWLQKLSLDYTTMHIREREMATKIVFELCNNVHLHQKMATKDLSLDYATCTHL